MRRVMRQNRPFLLFFHCIFVLPATTVIGKERPFCAVYIPQRWLRLKSRCFGLSALECGIAQTSPCFLLVGPSAAIVTGNVARLQHGNPPAIYSTSIQCKPQQETISTSISWWAFFHSVWTCSLTLAYFMWSGLFFIPLYILQTICSLHPYSYRL